MQSAYGARETHIQCTIAKPYRENLANGILYERRGDTQQGTLFLFVFGFLGSPVREGRFLPRWMVFVLWMKKRAGHHVPRCGAACLFSYTWLRHRHAGECFLGGHARSPRRLRHGLTVWLGDRGMSIWNEGKNSDVWKQSSHLFKSSQGFEALNPFELKSISIETSF